MDSGYGWYWEYSPYVVGRSGGIPRVGEIIQMDLKGPRADHRNPHTAIVVSVTATGMTWRDSNWNLDGKVMEHYISFSDFYSRVYLYSIYYIL